MSDSYPEKQIRLPSGEAQALPVDDLLLLTTTGVAELLGVHSSTVKRWCDEGSLRTRKTSGGHRRIHSGDALAAARDRGLSTFLDPFHPWEANVWMAFSDASRRGDYRRLLTLALGWLYHGEVDLLGRFLFEMGCRAEIPFPLYLDEVIRGFMTRVGEEWKKGKLPVGDEHMASQVVHEVLVRLRPGWDRVGSISLTPAPPPPVAIVGAMEGDQHDVGAQAIRVLLEREGWKVYYLGANVPLEEFGTVQAGQGASLVAVSFSPKNELPDLMRVVRTLGGFYRPESPYALALGGTLPEVSRDQLPEGPFHALSLSQSAQEFAGWLESHHDSDGDVPPRMDA